MLQCRATPTEIAIDSWGSDHYLTKLVNFIKRAEFMPNDSHSRRVTPRKWALAGTIAASTLAAAQPSVISTLSVAAMMVGSTADAAGASEAGEAGEAGVALTEGPAKFLTKLGYFEGTYRIIATLYLEGDRDLAREHMEESHHAFYEDIEDQLAEYKAQGFKSEHDVFLKLIEDDAPFGDVMMALNTLLDAVTETGLSSNAPLREEIMSFKDLMTLAAAEYEGGVEDGKVTLAMEYRDSWGFYETARRRAVNMSEAPDEIRAQAGKDVLERLEGLGALFPTLTSDTASTDQPALSAAAGWVEIVALRQD